MTDMQWLVVLFAAITTDNILLARFLGMCPFLSVSRKLRSSLGLGAAVIFVLTCTTVINYLVYYYLLVPAGLEYLRYIAFIITIAAFIISVSIEWIVRNQSFAGISNAIWLGVILITIRHIGAVVFPVEYIIAIRI